VRSRQEFFALTGTGSATQPTGGRIP
jgi:hypothetical protein